MFGQNEHETIALNIIAILKRTGDQWRELSWDEYKVEREKDGNFSTEEKKYFDCVLEYTLSPEAAASFSPTWKRLYRHEN